MPRVLLLVQIICFTFIFLCPSLISAHDLIGTVVNINDQTAIAGSTVEIIELSTSTQTDAGGKYTFTGLADGVYTLLVGAESYQPQIITNIIVGNPVLYVCGDANGDGNVNIVDSSYILNYIFFGGPSPNPVEAGDANADGNTNIVDSSYLINYIFFGGPGPCAK